MEAFAYPAYSGYVTATSSSPGRYIYVLPDSSSMSVGSSWQEWVTVFWKEGDYYYIQYSVSGYGGYKRGYIHQNYINQLSGGIPQSLPYSAWNTTCGSGTYVVFNCPNSSSYQIGSIWGNEGVTVLGEDSGYYYIQYSVSGGYKRGYVPISNITAQMTSDRDYYFNPAPSPYVYRSQGYGTHNGIDLAGPEGSLIYSAIDGNAEMCYSYEQIGDTTYTVSYGNHINVSDGYVSTKYAHLKEFATFQDLYYYAPSPYPSLQRSATGNTITYCNPYKEEVSRGTVIGYMGSTGNSGGNHLHFEFYVAGQNMNPDCYVNTIGSVTCIHGAHYTHNGLS